MTTTSVSTTSTGGKGKGKLTPADTRKPYDSFPLTFHPTGRFCKKSKGVTYYYGKVSEGWEKALEAFEKFWPYDSTGRARPTEASADAITVKQLCDHFYHAKQRLHDAGEITSRSLADYDNACKRITAALGRHIIVESLTAEHFGEFRAAIAKRLGPVALGNEINRCRMVFKHGYDNGLIDRPVKFGSAFSRPKAKVLRIHKAKVKAEHGKLLLEPKQIRDLLAIADVQLKAMIMLAINCGMGNNDMAELQFSDFDLEAGIIDYARPKTGIERRAHLWPETVDALKAAIEDRYEPKDEADAKCVFITKYKNRWSSGTSDNPISKSFTLLLKDLGLKRRGLSFYALRHTFATIGTEVRDDAAKNIIMGHVEAGTPAGYVEQFPMARLKAITDHLHGWLFPQPVKTKGKAKPTTKRKPKEQKHQLRIAS